jgi:hypothetical protein
VRQVTQTIYKFKELNDAAKEKAREWYRRASAGDSFWSEYILDDDAPTILKHLGYCDPKIQYSGFWSQGDGACFSGSWYSSDCKPSALKDYARDKEIARIAEELGGLIAAHPGMSATLTHRGHYSHEMGISFDVEFDEEDETDDGTKLACEEEFKELSRDLMRWIYKTLETEYEYQNADAQVDENIICNEYEFDEEGNLT